MTCTNFNCPDCSCATCVSGGCPDRRRDDTWSAEVIADAEDECEDNQ